LLGLRARWGERFRENEFFDRHASEGGEGFDLPMLLRFDFDRESVHTPKIVKIPKVVNRWSDDIAERLRRHFYEALMPTGTSAFRTRRVLNLV
jgi:hypothetical protein